MAYRVEHSLRRRASNTPYRKQRHKLHLTYKVRGIIVPAGQTAIHGRRLTHLTRTHQGLFSFQVRTPKTGKLSARYQREVAIGAAIRAGGGTVAGKPSKGPNAYYLAHRAQRLAYQAAYYQKHRAAIIAKIKALDKKKYQQNRAKILAAHKKYDHSPKGRKAQAKAYANFKAHNYTRRTN